MVHQLKMIAVIFLTSTIILSGCARVDVQKVPTITQYVHWTDDMQKKADRIKGIRFYLPRPFINVFESFPIRTDIYIAKGKVSPDGKYVIIREVRAESGLSSYIAGVQEGTQIVNRDIQDIDKEAAKEIIKAQASIEEDAAKAAKTTVPTGVAGIAPPTPSAAPEAQPRTGMSGRQVTNDNSAFAYQPLRGNFDIVYLPDFEEQYAVRDLAGLGNTEFALNLGQGWSLQGLNSLADNSALNQRIFDLIDTSIRMAKAAAQAAIGVPPVAALPSGLTEIIKPQAGKEMDDGIPGTDVSLKIVVIHYAAKGLYPIIKPREIQERTTQKTPRMFLGLFQRSPIWYSDYDSKTALQQARQAIKSETGKFTVPRYPYQYLSFNTFRYMALEVIKPDSPPYGTLYDKTGTTGDPGDRQTIDLGATIRSSIERTSQTDPDKSENEYTTFANELKTKSFTLKGMTIVVEDAIGDAKNKRVSLSLSVTGTLEETIEQQELKEAIITNLKGSEFGISAGQISIVNYDDIKNELTKVGAQSGEEEEEDKDQAYLFQNLKRSEIVQIQRALCMDRDDVDGVWGPITEKRLTASKIQAGEISTLQFITELLKLSDNKILEKCSASKMKSFPREAIKVPQTNNTELDDLIERIKSMSFNLKGVTIVVEDANGGAENKRASISLSVTGTPEETITEEALKKAILNQPIVSELSISVNQISIENFVEIKEKLTVTN